jgi:hypothetical protein
LHYDGSFEFVTSPFLFVNVNTENEKAAQNWMARETEQNGTRESIVEKLLQAWWIMRENKSFTDAPPEDQRRQGWREAIKDRVLELGWLDRRSPRQARFSWLVLPLQ